MRRVPSTDGVEVAVHDLGGGRQLPPLLIVHATGFCGPVYSPLAASLGSAFRCWAVDLRGHGVTSSPADLDYAWSGFAEDVLAVMDALGLQRPYALGHSSGGAAILLAEAARPGTFEGVWCYEPIVWPDPERARARAERLAEGAARRRNRFPSAEEAYANFAAKPPFSALSPTALRAYVDHGFAQEPDGTVALRCRPDVEAAIYRQAVTDDRFPRLAEVGCPAVVASGARSDAVTPPLAEQQVDRLPHGRLRVFDGLAHFGPLEDPAEVAQAVVADLVPPGRA